MELNLDIISDHLPKTVGAERLGPAGTQRGLGFPAIYEAGCELRRDRLYVARGEDLPPGPPQAGLSVVCVGRKPPPAWTEKGCRVLWVPDGFGLFALFNEINAIFDKFNRWEKNIIEEMVRISGFDIRRILAAGAAVLENPLSVVNATLMVLYEVRVTAREGGGFDVSVEQPNQPVGLIETVKTACRLERGITEPYFSSVTHLDKRAYCKNLFLFDRFVGCISVSEHARHFRGSDLALANHFFDLFQKAFGKQIRNALPLEPPETLALKNLLGSGPLGPGERAQLRLGEGERWVFFILRHQDSQSYMPIESMCATLNALMTGAVISLVRDEEIWGLLRLGREEKGERDQEYLEGFLAKMGYVAGLSSAYEDVFHTAIYLQFAGYALERGSKAQSSAHLFHFGDHVLDYIVTRYDGTFPAVHLYPRGLCALLEHDGGSPVSYVRTLRVFLENEMNVSKAAEALFLHRSSLVSRLEKILRLLDMDIEDPQNRLNIRLCLYLLDREKNKEPGAH